MSDSTSPATKKSSNLASLLLDTLIAPKAAMGEIVRSGRGWWLPLLLLIIATAGVLLYYPSSMSESQYVAMQLQEIEAAGYEINEEVLEGVQSAAKNSAIGAFVGALVLGLMLILLTIYYWLLGLMLGEERTGFAQAFNLAVWGSLPFVLGSLVQLANLMISNQPLLSTQIDPLTITLLLGLPVDSILGLWLAKISLFTLWSWWIKQLGFKQLYHTSTTTAVIVVAVVPLATYAAVAGFPFLIR